MRHNHHSFNSFYLRFCRAWRRTIRLLRHFRYIPNMFRMFWQGRLKRVLEMVLGPVVRQELPNHPQRRKKPDKPVAAPKSENKSESGWKYGLVRTEFINGLKTKGKTYQESIQIWDQSMEKARLLAPVTVGELKKRRFLSAGSTANPWYLKIHGPTN